MANHKNYTHVTPDQMVSGWHVAVIVIGVAITLPAFLVGAEIMAGLGTKRGLLAISLGGAILALIAIAAMRISVAERLTTYQLLDNSFGEFGSRLVSLLIALTLLGWFGVTVSLFGQAMAKSLEEIFNIILPVEAYVIFGATMMTCTTIFGFRAIDTLSKISVPLMMSILVVGVYFVSANFTGEQIWNAEPKGNGSIRSFGNGISIVVGSFMVGVVIIPDLSRFIKRKSQVYVASVGSFGSFFAFILVMAGLPGLMTGEKDLIISMYQSGLGVPALIMMIFASWTTNVNNLYSSSLGFAQTFPNVKGEIIIIAAGIVGSIMALLGIMEHLIGFLVFLGIFIPPIAGIYISHFYLTVEKCSNKLSFSAFASWGLALAIGFSTSSGSFTITTIPSLDSLLSALLFYTIITKAYVWLLRSQP